MNVRRLLWPFLIAALLVASVAAPLRADGTIAASAYVSSLDVIASALRRGDLATASGVARTLSGSRIASPQGSFVSDDALLTDVITARDGARRSFVAARVSLLADALRGGTTSVTAPAVDTRRLEALREDERLAALAPGGEIELDSGAADARLARHLADAWNWIKRQMTRAYDWLIRLWPSSRPSTAALSGAELVPWFVTALVIAIVALIAFLAVAGIRRGRRRAATRQSTNMPVTLSERDDDPLSRGMTEWERYAQQLAGEERYREAIRAWYHAVLVSLYGRGVLHYRKGRTNWEYVAALAPQIAWRPAFIQLTRRFEHEWYGRSEKPFDACDECRALARTILDEDSRRPAA